MTSTIGGSITHRDFDRRHVFQWNFVAELPFGKGKRFLNNAGKLDRVLGGWEVTGYGRLTSGRPFTAFSGSNTVSNVNQSTANCTGCSRGDGSPFLDPASGLIWYFDAAERAKFSAPGAGQFGNTGRNYFVGPHYFEIDASLLKRIPRDGANQARVPGRRHQPDQQPEFRRAHDGYYQFYLRTHIQQLPEQQFAQDSARRQDTLLAETMKCAA